MSEITWPAGLTTGTIGGRLGTFRSGGGASLPFSNVTIRPDTTPVRYTGTDGPLTLLDAPIHALVDQDGWLCRRGPYGAAGARGIVLPASTDDKLVPTGFTWKLTVHAPGGDVSFRFTLDAGETKDLARTEPVVQSGGIYKVTDTAARDEALAAAELVRDLLAALPEQVVLDPEGATLLITTNGDGTYSFGTMGQMQGLKPDGTLPTAATVQVQAMIDTVPGIREVAGTIPLPATGRRVLEFYTTGAATIGGVAFPADTAVVFRRTGAGAWTYRTVTAWTAIA